ncbi:General secretion pathway protein A [hydrothermal vent metagenome]|uniref:General secretion pathway protein A n=1 Tax=hydrothermal vent metagenome TaxID=652676 RepID=A0A3B0WWF7_9ZZZZ
MYLDHFGLLEPPFSIAPDPRYLFMSERHREALAHLLYGMDSNGAFILLTGEVGTGKTTVSRCLLEQVPENTNLALVLNPKLSAIELLQVICDELRVVYDDSELSVKALVDYINRYLLGAHAQGKKTVVLIEEAQNLDLDVLEQLRLLTNLETNQQKLLQVILLGQPEFLEVLDRPELSQLAQRITARFHLKPLSLNEVGEYIGHRLAIAGCRRPLFTGGVIRQIYKYTGGVPRLINVLCDRALLGCYVSNRFQIDRQILAKAASETLGERKAARLKFKRLPLTHARKLSWASAVLLLVASVVFFTEFIGHHLEEEPQASTPDEPQADERASGEETTTEKLAPEELKPEKEAPEKEVSEKADLPRTAKNEIKTTRVDAEVQSGATAETNAADKQQTIANDAEDVSEQSIKWPENNQRLRSNLQAYQSLFSQWGLSYNLIRDGTPCYYAQTQGLSCLRDQADINGLRKLNRPAVLKLQDDLKRPQYIALLELGRDSAKIAISKQVQTIPLALLKAHWQGDYAMLWRAPPGGYQGVIKPGAAGETIVWLSQMLNKVENSPDKVAGSFFDDNLIKRVKKFQLSQKIESDGTVGAETLIHLNQVVGQQAPVLGST